MRFNRAVARIRDRSTAVIRRRPHNRGWPPLRAFSDSGSVGPFYDNYTVRAASRPRNICSIGRFLNYLKRDRPWYNRDIMVSRFLLLGPSIPFLLSSSIFFHFSGPPASHFFPSSASPSLSLGGLENRNVNREWTQIRGKIRDVNARNRRMVIF